VRDGILFVSIFNNRIDQNIFQKNKGADMLNLEWFRTFKAIYETGSLSAAARTLYISQPGVSLHLNSLEAYVGYPLFGREPRKMIPTERALMLYNFIVDSLSKLAEAEHVFYRNSKTEKPAISVGMTFETFDSTLAEHMAQVPFNLVVRFGECPQLLKELDNGDLDLVLTSQQGSQHNLEYTPFIKERIILACGSKTDTRELDKLASENNKDGIRDWLAQQIWYTSTADKDHLRDFWLANFDSLPTHRPNYLVPYFSSILRCLRNSKGFALLPDFVCKNDLRQKSVRLAWDGGAHFGNTLLFGKRKKTTRAAEIRHLEKILTKNWFGDLI
jgi:DNA-binding transcriptional LysR family regulator